MNYRMRIVHLAINYQSIDVANYIVYTLSLKIISSFIKLYYQYNLDNIKNCNSIITKI